MSITAVQSTMPVQPTDRLKPEKPAAPPVPQPSLTKDTLQLGQTVKETAMSELLTGTFMGGIFGGGLSIVSMGFVPEATVRTLNAGPVLFAGAIGATVAGLITDDPLKGAAIGAGTNAILQGAFGAITGGWQGALIQGLAGAVGGAAGGAVGSALRGRLSEPPRRPSDAAILQFHAAMRASRNR